MKNQRGITMLVLVTTVIILALIVGSVSYSSNSSMKLKKYYNMCSDIELLDEKIALFYVEKGTLPVSDTDKIQLNTMISDYSQDNVNYNPNNSGELHKINLFELDNLTLNYTDYYIDIQSHTVYSANGVVVDGETFYTTPINYEEVNLNLYQ